MLRSLVPLAVVPVVPHDCPPNRGIHAKELPIPAQPFEASSTAACPGGDGVDDGACVVAASDAVVAAGKDAVAADRAH